MHITALGDDYFKYDRRTHTISGFRGGNSFRLGDEVRVAVATVDVDARELDFRLFGKGPASDRREKRSKGTKSGKPVKPVSKAKRPKRRKR